MSNTGARTHPLGLHRSNQPPSKTERLQVLPVTRRRSNQTLDNLILVQQDGFY